MNLWFQWCYCLHVNNPPQVHVFMLTSSRWWLFGEIGEPWGHVAKVAELSFLKEPLLTPGGRIGQDVNKLLHTPSSKAWLAPEAEASLTWWTDTLESMSRINTSSFMFFLSGIWLYCEEK